MTTYKFTVENAKPPYDVVYMRESDKGFVAFIPKEINGSFHNDYERKRYLKYSIDIISKVLANIAKPKETK